MPTLATANPLIDIESDGKKEFNITNSDHYGQIHNSIIFAQSEKEAEKKFDSSQLGAKRKKIKVTEVKIHPTILFEGIIAEPLDSAQAAA